MPKILDESLATDIAENVLNLLYDEGYLPEEIIPGLITAVVQAADGNDQMLDEAANLLADGGVE